MPLCFTGDAVNEPSVIQNVLLHGGKCVRLLVQMPRKGDLLKPSDVLTKWRELFREIIKSGASRIQNCYSMKIWINATTAWQKPPDGEEFFRYYSLDSEFITNDNDSIENLLDKWCDAFLKRADIDTNGGSGFRINGCPQLLIYISCIFKTKSIIKGSAHYTGRGRRSLFDPLVTRCCLIECLKAYRYLKSSRKIYSVETEFEMNNFILDQSDFGLIYDPSVEGYKIDELENLEHNNKLSIYVYVLYAKNEREEERHLVVARHGSPKYTERVCILLVNNASHAMLIVDFSKFVATMTNNRSKFDYYCEKCLWGCYSHDVDGIVKHNESSCSSTKSTIIFPQRNKDNWIIKFDQIEKTYRNRFIGVFDSESILEKTTHKPGILSNHKTVAWCFLIIEENVGPIWERYYVGPDAANTFVKQLTRDWLKIYDNCVKYPLDRNERARNMFDDATHCKLCKCIFSNDHEKQQHHDHAKKTDNIISILCGTCNRVCRDKSKILTVIGHNSNTYDMNVILRECEIPLGLRLHNKSNTRFHSLRTKHLNFIDSYAHLNAPLEQLASLHVEANRPLQCLNYVLEPVPKEAHCLLKTGKQHFFYEWMDSVEKLKRTSLPPIEESFSTIAGRTLTLEEYQHIEQIWHKAGCKNIQDLLIIYLKVDTGFLADVVLAYRSVIMQHLGLEAMKYVSAPAVSWHGMLKYTGIELEMLTEDISWLSNLIKNNIRGGLSMAFTSYVKSNNEYCSDYNPNMPRTEQLQLDQNGLYANAECYPLPVGGFKRLPCDALGQNAKHLKDIDVINSPTGYYLLVDTHIPDRVRRETDDYPLMINNVTITRDMLSDHHKKLYEKTGQKFIPSRRLLACHLDQKEILMTAILLQQLMQLGLEITRVHYVISFRQSRFMKKYIEANIDLRKNAIDDVTRGLAKLINNSVFGRTIFSIANHCSSLHLIENEKQFLSNILSPFFRSAFELNENRMIAVRYKEQVTQTSPLYIGFSILDISKTIMYGFYYNVLKAFYGNRINHVYTDTDSLSVQIETQSFDQDLLMNPSLRKHFDTSNYPKNHPLYSEANKNALGCVKSESKSDYVDESVFLRSKSYSLKLASGSNKKVAKGIRRGTTKSEVLHEHYLAALNSAKTFTYSFGSIKINEQNVQTTQMKRIGISPIDLKRYMIDPYNSLCYGHPDIKKKPIHKLGDKNPSVSRAVILKRKWDDQKEYNVKAPKLFVNRLQTIKNPFFS